MYTKHIFTALIACLAVASASEPGNEGSVSGFENGLDLDGSGAVFLGRREEPKHFHHGSKHEQKARKVPQKSHHPNPSKHTQKPPHHDAQKLLAKPVHSKNPFVANNKVMASNPNAIISAMMNRKNNPGSTLSLVPSQKSEPNEVGPGGYPTSRWTNTPIATPIGWDNPTQTPKPDNGPLTTGVVTIINGRTCTPTIVPKQGPGDNHDPNGYACEIPRR